MFKQNTDLSEGMELFYAMCFFAEQYDSKITFVQFQIVSHGKEIIFASQLVLLLHLMYIQ